VGVVLAGTDKMGAGEFENCRFVQNRRFLKRALALKYLIPFRINQIF
jgi:hypothetical protein